MITTFRKGVHPKSNKHRTCRLPIASPPLPDMVVVPLVQHIGAPAKPLKSRGDAVSPGEPLAEMGGRVSAGIHSPVAGTVKRLVQKPLPGGRMADHLEIVVDREATEAHGWERRPIDIDPDTIVKRIADAGIVGMGGATFPTHIKYSPPSTTPIDVFIVNGAECEPYLTCDHRLMVERASEIVSAVRVLHGVFSFEMILFGVEENKPDALSALEEAVREASDLPARVVTLAVKYPQGAEKMLIHAMTGRVVPAGKLPLDIGVIVSNVATLNAIYEATHLGKPLIDRVITVSGDGVHGPANLRVPIGTSFEHIAEVCGGIDEATKKVVVGGPMMGIAVPTLDYSVSKGVSGLLFFTDGHVPETTPCITCGRCVRVCPMNLMPLKFAAYAKANEFERVKAMGVENCFECGSCAFACPAKIPIVAWIRYAKNSIRARGV